MNAQIANAAEHQNQMTEEINSNIDNIGSVVAQTMDAADETMEEAGHINLSVEELRTQATRFKLSTG